MRSRWLIGFGLLVGGVGVVLSAQTQPERLIFRSGVDLIEVDVSVVDDDSRPITGLDARLHWEPASPAARPALSPLDNSRAFPGTSCGSRSGSPLWLPPSDLAAFGLGPSDR